MNEDKSTDKTLIEVKTHSASNLSDNGYYSIHIISLIFIITSLLVIFLVPIIQKNKIAKSNKQYNV